MKSIVSDGTFAYIAKLNGLRKVTVADGTDVTLSTAKEFVAVTYGNSTLYAADQDGLYSVNTTTGALTVIADIEGIEGIMYLSATNILVMTKNSLMNVLLADGTYTYIIQSL